MHYDSERLALVRTGVPDRPHAMRLRRLPARKILRCRGCWHRRAHADHAQRRVTGTKRAAAHNFTMNITPEEQAELDTLREKRWAGTLTREETMRYDILLEAFHGKPVNQA